MDRYDVVICGGGLAGLTLARQLKLKMPELSVLILERTDGDIPGGAHKVGEATVEGGAHYFGEHLQLAGYFNKHHLPKLGLRLFFGDAHGVFEDRPELGARKFPRVPSYQIDRGIFERDLRRMVREQGAHLVEMASVEHLELSSTGDHLVSYAVAGEGGGQSRTVRAHFVVDATGRRRLIQRTLGLELPSVHHINSVWWRFRGEYDVEKMAAAKNLLWKPKNQERKWFSTNHLMGRGYWIWMIPLSSGATSVGIVADADIHPFAGYNTEERAHQWIEAHEPTLAAFLRGAEALDFRKMKDCSYYSRQIFSHDRWACVGEAGTFLDAFYSPGSDFIAYTNSITTKMIELDRKSALTPAITDQFNRFVLEDLWNNYLAMYHDTYQVFGNATVMFTKAAWDVCYYWGLPCQMLFRKLMVEPWALEQYRPIAAAFHPIQKKMQQCFRDWARVAPLPSQYLFVEYSKIPICAELHIDLLREEDPTRCFQNMRRTVARLEEWADSLAAEVYGGSLVMAESSAGKARPTAPPAAMT